MTYNDSSSSAQAFVRTNAFIVANGFVASRPWADPIFPNRGRHDKGFGIMHDERVESSARALDDDFDP